MALSEFEKKMKRANTILYNADKMGLSNDAIENARHMLELTYKNMQDNFKAKNNKIFTKSKKLDWKQQRILENIADKLIENPQANIKNIFSKKNDQQINDIMTEQGLSSKQEVLDFFDIMNRHKNSRLMSQMLDSNQVKEMFDIARKKNITTKELNDIINEELKKDAREQLKHGGFVEQNDEVAIAIRKRLRAKRKRKK